MKRTLNHIYPPVPLTTIRYARSGMVWWAIPPKRRAQWFHPLAWERLTKARANLHLFHFGFDGRYDFPKARAMAKGESPVAIRKLIATLAEEAKGDREALRQSLERRLFYLKQLLCFALALQPPDQRGHLLGGFEGGLKAWAKTLPGAKPLPPPTPIARPKRAPALGTKAKEAILSRVALGMKPSEVAKELGITLNTVYRFLAKHKENSQ